MRPKEGGRGLPIMILGGRKNVTKIISFLFVFFGRSSKIIHLRKNFSYINETFLFEKKMGQIILCLNTNNLIKQWTTFATFDDEHTF